MMQKRACEECERLRAERDAANTRAEEAENESHMARDEVAREADLKQDLRETIHTMGVEHDRLVAKALRNERIETMQAINSEALRWSSKNVRTACRRILKRVKRCFAHTDTVICCECGRDFDRSDAGADRKMVLATGEWKWVCPACMAVVQAAVGTLVPEGEVTP